eukprot:28326-Ditylum_brightwellii.AAC.1
MAMLPKAELPLVAIGMWLQDTELVHALRLFTWDIGGCLPQQMIADCDFTLIGSVAAKYLEGIVQDQISDKDI